jgi:hypothetical protein
MRGKKNRGGFRGSGQPGDNIVYGAARPVAIAGEGGLNFRRICQRRKLVENAAADFIIRLAADWMRFCIRQNAAQDFQCASGGKLTGRSVRWIWGGRLQAPERDEKDCRE